MVSLRFTGTYLPAPELPSLLPENANFETKKSKKSKNLQDESCPNLKTCISAACCSACFSWASAALNTLLIWSMNDHTHGADARGADTDDNQDDDTQWCDLCSKSGFSKCSPLSSLSSADWGSLLWWWWFLVVNLWWVIMIISPSSKLFPSSGWLEVSGSRSLVWWSWL